MPESFVFGPAATYPSPQSSRFPPCVEIRSFFGQEGIVLRFTAEDLKSAA